MLSSSEVAGLRSAAEAHLLDTCVIQSYSETRDSLGTPSATYTDGAATACGFQSLSAAESRTPEGTTIRADAALRLPLSTLGSLDTRSRIRLTHVLGVALSPAITYSIVGRPEPGKTTVLVRLERL